MVSRRSRCGAGAAGGRAGGPSRRGRRRVTSGARSGWSSTQRRAIAARPLVSRARVSSRSSGSTPGARADEPLAEPADDVLEAPCGRWRRRVRRPGRGRRGPGGWSRSAVGQVDRPGGLAERRRAPPGCRPRPRGGSAVPRSRLSRRSRVTSVRICSQTATSSWSRPAKWLKTVRRDTPAAWPRRSTVKPSAPCSVARARAASTMADVPLARAGALRLSSAGEQSRESLLHSVQIGWRGLSGPG